MEKRRLGRLGHMSSVLVYGGAALAAVDRETADESVAFALTSGINHFDTSDDYGDSELHLGRWMARVRDDVFLATKTTERSKEGAEATIHRSLERLDTDHLDLVQLHAICTPEDLHEVTDRGGALEAVVAAREEGIVRGIGITGHGKLAAATHLEALRGWPFDTVLTPYSYRLTKEDGFTRDFEALVEEVKAQDVGLMLIKHMARNLWRDDTEPRYATWYEPLDEQRHIDAAVAFALARREATGICTAGDVRLLAAIVDAERRASSLAAEEIEVALSEVDGYATPFASKSGRSTPDWLEEPA